MNEVGQRKNIWHSGPKTTVARYREHTQMDVSGRQSGLSIQEQASLPLFFVLDFLIG